MKITNLALAILLTILLGLPAYTLAASVEFQLFTSTYNAGKLPQQPQTIGDYLPQTGDDYELTGSNPDGCFSFNFMNPTATSGGYAKGIHSMTGSVTLDIDLQTGGALDIVSLAFDGYISSTQSSFQRLPMEAATQPTALETMGYTTRPPGRTGRLRQVMTGTTTCLPEAWAVLI